jgi:alcohol dehydrogenase, propanol-preferring
LAFDATMRAAVVEQHGAPLLITQVPRPQPGPGQILLKLEASGICHTDVHVWLGHALPRAKPSPFVLGHEGVGHVVAIGAGVEGWSLGDRAGIGWIHATCGACDECGGGHESFCQNQTAHGFDVAGSFAEYVVTDHRFAAALPAGNATQLAPLLCAGLTAYGALERAAVQAGEHCVVFGCGGLGLYAVQLAVRRGAVVTAVDTSAEKLALARSYGASSTVHPRALTDDAWPLAERAHVCINFAPTPATWPLMLSAIRPRGRIVAAAMVQEPVSLNQEWLTYTGVTITGTSVGTRAQMQDLIALHVAKPLACHVEQVALTHASECLAALHEGRATGRYCIVY